MAEDYKLIDNEEKHRYEFQIDGKIAEIDYIKSNNGEIYLVHTEVPASLGGKGVGSQLAEKALADMAMMGMISASGRFMARMVLAASQPFIRGIIISI